MKMNNPEASTASFSPVAGSSRVSALEVVGAVRLDDLVPVRTAMLGVASICSTRYYDIDAASDGPRTSIVTDRAALREVQRGLAGGVGAADDVHVLVGAAHRLGQRGAVEHAAAGQRLGAAGASSCR